MEEEVAAIHYKWQMHEFLADGTLRIRTSVYQGCSHSVGKYDVAPDNSDFAFWIWVIQDKKPTRRVCERDVATVHVSHLKALREEFREQSLENI